MDGIVQKKRFTLPFYSNVDQQTHDIVIDSKFDSGNLGNVYFENLDQQKVFFSPPTESWLSTRNKTRTTKGSRSIPGLGSFSASKGFPRHRIFLLHCAESALYPACSNARNNISDLSAGSASTAHGLNSKNPPSCLGPTAGSLRQNLSINSNQRTNG